ncbi:TRAP transporter small permease [Lysinibacillus sphaericus]
MILKWIKSVDDIISTIALSLIILLTGINVFLRFVMDNPVAWVEEVTIGLFIWVVFIGISSAMRRESHIGVDYFIKKMPKPLRILCEAIRAAAIYYVLIYVFVFLGIGLAEQAVSKVTPILGVKYLYIDAAVPLGGILAAIHFTWLSIRSFLSQSANQGGS